MPTKTIQINPTPKFIPYHVRGDRDFSGNGPWVYVSAQLRIVNQNQLWVRVYMWAREMGGDWTTVEGSTDYFVYNGQWDDVARITRIISDPFSYTPPYVDSNHSDDNLQLTAYELVEKFVVTGDTRSDDVGNTGVIVHFNPIEFEPLQDVQDIVTISDIGPTPKWVPPHVAGDRDFSGNGPDIDVTASISVENNTEIWALVSMRAIETRRDYTEASGSTRYMIYRHDRRIVQILSGTQSSRYYRDNNHQTDVVSLATGELVRQFFITGDTRGNEAGDRTGVVVYFNPITFRQEV